MPKHCRCFNELIKRKYFKKEERKKVIMQNAIKKESHEKIIEIVYTLLIQNITKHETCLKHDLYSVELY